MQAHARSRRHGDAVRYLALGTTAALAAAFGTCVLLAGPSSHRAAHRACIDVAHGLPELELLDRRLGAAISCLTMFADATSTWDQWEHPWFLTTKDRSARYAEWVRADPTTRKLSITLSMVPSDVAGDWRQQGARGAYDAHARTLGRTLVAAGLGGSIIRLSPEANIQGGNRSAGSTPTEMGAWARYWSRLSADLKSVPGAHFQLDWTVNAAVRPIPFSDYYPGNDAVDIIGVDCYDSLADGRKIPAGPGRWAHLVSQPYGLGDVVRFAAGKHKPLSVPEWGAVAEGSYGGGDDPYYISQMAALFHQARLAYQSYFDVAVGGTLPLDQVPRSFATYRRDVIGRR